MSKEDLDFLYKDLFVKPQLCGPNFGQDDATVSVYRENTNKIYIPRFFGIERYGIPNKNTLTSGDDNNVDFAKSLRDYQENIINIYLNYVKSKVSNNPESINGNGAILEVPCGRGKTVIALKLFLN